MNQMEEIALGVAVITADLAGDTDALHALAGQHYPHEIADALRSTSLALVQELADRRGIEPRQVLAEVGWRAATSQNG